MAKAVVNPAELRRFAQNLQRFNSNLKEEVSGVKRQFSKLSESWQDQEQEKFAEVFEEMVRSLIKFTDTSDRHVPYLLRKADKIQEYLNQR